MQDSTPESVTPSPEPDAAVGTGSGHDPGGSTPPPSPSDGASTSGLGTQDSQHGDAGGSHEAPYDLDGEQANPTEPRSPSGT